VCQPIFLTHNSWRICDPHALAYEKRRAKKPIRSPKKNVSDGGIRTSEVL
jgi:hypothetical protein